jgi:hypothetical protein
MLKKLLIYLPLLALALGGFWLWQRWNSNPAGVIPMPYTLPLASEKIDVDAPMLIVGDRMAKRFGLFKESFSLEISQGLSKPLKIGVLAQEGQGLHRTLRDLESLEKWPRVLLYTGGSEEMREEKFLTREIATTRYNFARYDDDTYRTLLMLWPDMARLIYRPIVRQVLPDQFIPGPPKAIDESEFQARLELSLKLYEIELQQLVQEAREHKSLLILMTVPVNLDVSPNKTCGFAQSPEITREINTIRELIKKQDYKTSYQRSRDLAQATLANAEVFFLAGQIASRLGKNDEAVQWLQQAVAYDCSMWRSSEITNNIIRKVARDQGVTLFDFAAMVQADWKQNTTFFDEIYPQDLYYEKASKALALVLRRILKL